MQTKIVSLFAFLLLLFFKMNLAGQGTDYLAPGLEQNRYIKIKHHFANASSKTVQSWAQGYFSALKQGSTLTLLDSISSPGGIHYQFQQVYQGLAVFDANLKINLKKNGELLNALPNLIAIPSNVQPHFHLSEAELNHYIIEKEGLNPNEIRPTLFLKAKKFIPTYRVLLPATDSTDAQECVYDAQNGTRLLQRSRAARRSQLAEGKGYVYLPDPLTAAGVFYQSGSEFADNANQTNSFLDNQRKQVTLHDLTKVQDTFWLEGPYVKIVELFAPTTERTFSLDGNFYYNRSQNGFEDVNAYYHIDTYQRYVQSLGYNNLHNIPILVDAHGDNSDNSSFTPDGAQSYIRFGIGGVDDAEDADVVVHEYGHALSNGASPNTNTGIQRRGLDEGIGDYIAATYSRKLNTFRWQELFTWDGHNEFWAGRQALTSDNYATTKQHNDIYRYGTLWASTLLQVSNIVGSTTSDKIFFQSLYLNNSQITLSDAAYLYLDADTLLYNGENSKTLLQAFCGVGLIEGNLCQTAAVEDLKQNNRQLNLFPNPVTEGLLTIRFVSENGNYSTLQYVITDIYGRKLNSGPLQTAFTQINVSSLSPGAYYMQVYKDNIPLGATKFVVWR